jgi:antitoxin VapB
MALNIEDPEAEQLAAEVARMAGESKTAAVRIALRERRDRLAQRQSRTERELALRWFLETEVWSQLPQAALGNGPSKAERETILGYRPDGV